MSTSVCLVFPQQLFEQHPAFAHAQEFWLIEDELFFTKVPFHQKKLALHRASMIYYAEYLRSKDKNVRYFDTDEANLESLFQELGRCTKQIVVVDPTDFLLEKRIRRFVARYHLGPVSYTHLRAHETN
jgi:deoxyribodipyrimidine photolyase-related protein